MGCSEAMKTTIPPEVRARAREIADRELLSEAAWLKRLVIREIRACQGASDEGSAPSAGGVRDRSRVPRGRGCARAMHVRLRTGDKLLIHRRAEARGIGAGH